MQVTTPHDLAVAAVYLGEEGPGEPGPTR
jgi:hypothetical protein